MPWPSTRPGEAARIGGIAGTGRSSPNQPDNGSVAIFPPPHQYLYPLDFADNFKLVWHGKGWQQKVDGYGIGVRQPPEGDKRHVPWMNAPPHTEQAPRCFLPS